MAEISTALCQEVTIVVLGLDSASYVARAQCCYQQAGVPMLALDLSLVGQAGRGWREQLQEALQQVGTPFVVLAMAADFVLTEALSAAAAFLQAHPKLAAAQGSALGFKVGNAKVMYYKLGGLRPVSVVQGGGQLNQYGLAGRQAWRAVTRVPFLHQLLDTMPSETALATFLLQLSYAMLTQGDIAALEQTDVLCAYDPVAESSGARNEQLSRALHDLRRWDAGHQAVCADDTGYAVLNRFVRETYDYGQAPLLFTSSWNSVISDPERSFEANQYVEMPYYNRALFAQLTALEFLCHAWPVGEAQYRALEGAWVRQHHLAKIHPNDTAESLQLRYWQALALGLFDPQVCRQLVSTLSAPDDAERVRELHDWLQRLGKIAGMEALPRLQATSSGQLMAALEAARPNAAAIKRVQEYLSARSVGQIAFVVMDLANDDAGLQDTFDSLVACGIKDFKLVVLKIGKPPVITSPRDTLHFIQVTDSNWVAHLNQAVRQLSSEWLLMLQAGDELVAGGLLHLLVELAESPACQAVCVNEVQRDEEGRLHAVERPGADVNLLRSLPGLMSRHWLVRRQAIVALGGYSESHRHALELDVLLRLVEAQGLSSLAHLDDFLVIGEQASPALSEEAVRVVSRHLTQLGYRAQINDQCSAGLLIDYRHSTTPLVSILVASQGDMLQLQACLTSVMQRTRYPRYEVVVVCAEHEMGALQHLGARVRLLLGEPGKSCSGWLNQAASAARGDYLVLLAERCELITPAWIEALLNEAQRPEVGVAGALLQTAEATLAHAGYALVEGPRITMPWQGLSVEALAQARWPLAVRSCQAVSADCLMISKELFQQCAGLQIDEGAAIDLCLAAADAGRLVVWTPQAQLKVCDIPMVSDYLAQTILARWPSAFTGVSEFAPALAWLARVK